MIQIHSPEQFKKAEARARKERMLVQPTGNYREFRVTNRSKGSSYIVFFSTLNKKFFGVCNCAAGTPCNGRRIPRECKHLFAALLVLRALSGKVHTSH